MIEDDDSHDSEFSMEGKGENNIEDSPKEEKKKKKWHAQLVQTAGNVSWSIQ